MIDIRLKTIYEEGSKLFINKGFARTQISYIANAANISVGAVYTLFTSKKAVFDFVMKCTMDSEYIESNFELPIKEKDFCALDGEILALCQRINANFEEHLSDRSYTFTNMLSDVFDIISKYGVGFLILQNNGTDCKEPYAYYVDFRKKFCADVEKYVYRFMETGEIRKLEHPKHHARLIIETLSWWGMHVKYDAFETNSNISTETAKETALDALFHAYSSKLRG